MLRAQGARTAAGAVAIAVGVLVAGCGEKPQTETGRRSDQKIWAGTKDGYSVSGWRAGDAASWEEQMRARARNQNEYTRTVNSPARAAVVGASLVPTASTAAQATAASAAVATAVAASNAMPAAPAAAMAASAGMPAAASAPMPASAPASAPRNG